MLPAVLKYAQDTKGFSDEEICRALATAGVIGNLTKTNASISGAECGCQAEIGTACSMAAAALAELYGQNLDQVEYAAEVAMEHHLGLTCDPICGLVQIPCIERNAVAAGVDGSTPAADVCAALQKQFATMKVDGLTGKGMTWDYGYRG